MSDVRGDQLRVLGKGNKERMIFLNDACKAALEAWLEAHPEGVVICDEVGCGVVPMDREERAWREQVGRTCCRLAERAAAVYRVTCGLGVRLK